MRSLVLASLLTAAPGLDVLCEKADAGVDDFAAPLAEISNHVDWQRRAYAEAWLFDHGSTPEQCPRLVDLATPRELSLESGPVRVTWRPTRLTDWQRFTSLTVDADTFELPTEFVLAAPPRLVREDFDFDGRLDVRLISVLSVAHSQRFDLVLLAKADGHYAVSPQLSALDDLTVNARRKVLTSRVVDPNTKRSSRQTLRWKGGALVKVR